MNAFEPSRSAGEQSDRHAASQGLTAQRAVEALSSRPRRAELWAPIVLCAFGLLSIVVFTPWRRGPFDTLDFSEFLLNLERHTGFWAQWAGLANYYAGQGRVNEIGYGIIAANYHFFGRDPLGWQVVRCIQVALLPPASYVVLRKFGAGRLGSLIGASFYAVGTIPAAAWLRQTGEPLGTLFMLAGAIMAHGWAESPRSARRTIVLTVCLTCMVLCKETLVACLPFLCLVAACWSAENRVHAPRFGRRTAHFAAACLVACLVLGAAMLWASLRRQADAYAALYGTSILGSLDVIGRVAQAILPDSHHADLQMLLASPPNFVFIVCVGAGLAVMFRLLDVRRRLMPKLAIAASLLVAGILVYLPWPRFELFYAIPFFFGVVLAVALLVDASAVGPRSRLILIVCWLFILTGSALQGFGLAQITYASRELNYVVATQIARYSALDTVVITSATLTRQSWQNPAATLSRYARAVGLTARPPVLVDHDCRAHWPVEFTALPEHAIEFVYEASCGRVSEATRTIEKPFRYFDWATLKFQADVQRVSILEPTE
jgi:hypothetical protein